jgi:predicted secreted protein
MRDYIDIEDNGEEWDVIPASSVPEPSHWEALPFFIFTAVSVAGIIFGAFYRLIQELQ